MSTSVAIALLAHRHAQDAFARGSPASRSTEQPRWLDGTREARVPPYPFFSLPSPPLSSLSACNAGSGCSSAGPQPLSRTTQTQADMLPVATALCSVRARAPPAPMHAAARKPRASLLPGLSLLGEAPLPSEENGQGRGRALRRPPDYAAEQLLSAECSVVALWPSCRRSFLAIPPRRRERFTSGAKRRIARMPLVGRPFPAARTFSDGEPSPTNMLFSPLRRFITA